MNIIFLIIFCDFRNVIAVSVMSGNVYLIDPLNPEKQRVLNDHHKYVVCVKFNEDGTLFATASHDHSINLYKYLFAIRMNKNLKIRAFDYYNLFIVFYS